VNDPITRLESRDARAHRDDFARTIAEWHQRLILHVDVVASGEHQISVIERSRVGLDQHLMRGGHGRRKLRNPQIRDPVDVVEEGFDLAIRVGTLPDSSQLVARRLGMQRMGICGAPAYLDRHGRPSNPSELNGHLRLAYLTAGRATAWRVHDEAGEVVLPQVKTRLGFDDLQAIADAAIAGAGLAWLPCWMMAPELKTGRLELVVSHDRVPGTEIHALWPRMTHLPMKVRVAVDALVSEIPQMLSQ
jgi:DNA-binding transcriptional LysR family regulator